MVYFHVLLAILLAAPSFGAQLPSSFTKCERKDSNFNTCLAKAIEDAVHELATPKAYKELGLAGMNPLEIPALTIGAGTSAVSVQQNFRNMKVTGYDKIKCPKAELDFSKKSLLVDCTFPEFEMNFHYNISGNILLLPISGDGPGVMTLYDLASPFNVHFDEFEKNGKKHFKILDHKIELTPQKIHFKIDNLFGGDKALGDNINNVLNENWKDLFDDVKANYADAFSQIYVAMFDRLLSKISINDLFGEK